MMSEKNKTILLVEDEVIIAMVKAETIKQFGYTVLLAYNGNSAIEIATGNAIVDLILMDIDLGKNIDGTEAARRILEKINIPIVFLTSHSEREMVERVRGITRYGYVIKDSGDFVLQSSIEMAFELFAAHEKTRSKENELSAIYENAPSIIILLDSDLKIKKVNRQTSEFTKMSHEDVIGLRVGTIIKCVNSIETVDGCGFGSHCNECMLRKTMINTVETGINHENIEVHLSYMSEGIPVDIYFILSTKLIDICGERQILLNLLDITERKYTEELLINSEENYRSIFEESFDGLFVTSPDGKIIDMNKKGVSMFGYNSKEEVQSLNLERDVYVFPSDRNRILSLVNAQGTAEYEMYVKKKNGQIMITYCALTVVTDKKGEVLSYRGVIRDISKQKLAENQILKLNRVYAVLSSINQSIIRIQDRQNLLDESCGIAVELGKFPYAWIGFVNDQTKKVDVVASYGNFKEYLETINIDLNDEMRSCGPTGMSIKTGEHKIANNIQNDASMMPWRDDAIKYNFKSSAAFPLIVFDKVIGAFNIYSDEIDFFDMDDVQLFDKIAMDISFALETMEKEIKRKEAEDEISRLNEDLERMVAERTSQLDTTNKELASFIYSFSHDLHISLRGIDGYSLILLEEHKTKLDAQEIDYLQRVRLLVQHMSRLIDDLLNLSRVSRCEMHLQEVNVSLIAHEIADELHQTFPERQVEFAIQEGVSVQGDVRLLHIVMENLIGNAWKFTSKHPNALIEFGMRQQKNKCVLFVHDDGAGFDMKYEQKLFNIFQRLHTIAEFPGNGVGLATVRQIIARHGGETWAYGEIEKGAVFYFTVQQGVSL
jgi:PAS domain S-box-containing protein